MTHFYPTVDIGDLTWYQFDALLGNIGFVANKLSPWGSGDAEPEKDAEGSDMKREEELHALARKKGLKYHGK